MADFEKVVPPGKEGKVNIKIDGKKLENPGTFEKSFTVTTNDPQNRQFVLVVHGTVKKAFDFSNEMRWSGFPDQDLKVENTITNLLPTPVNISGAKWVDDNEVLKLKERFGLKVQTIEKGKKFILKVWKKGTLVPSSFVGQIELTTDHPQFKTKRVLMSFDIMSEVQIQPERVLYGEMVLSKAGPKSFDRVFTIMANRGDSLKVLKAVPNRNDMTVKIEELQRGKSYRGIIRVSPKAAGAYLGSIKVYTNYAKYKEVNVDVLGSAREEDQ